MSIFQRIGRAVARLNRALGSAEGTGAGAGPGVNPALRHVEAAEHQEFPPEEFAGDDREDSE
jgi:hypothetical protein